MNRHFRRQSRRKFLKLLGLGSIAVPFTGLAPIDIFRRGIGQANAAVNSPRRLLQIFLQGGWDSALATDPVAPGGGKALSTNYQAEYFNGTVANPSTQVPGKSNLFVGPGLYEARTTFASVPTAFVNGIYIEVTAHDLAVNYMLSGQLSLSRSREYPAFIASLADKHGGFPAHVILGSAIPLGDTKNSNPPIQSIDVEQFIGQLAGPRSPGYFNLKEPSLAAAEDLIGSLNTLRHTTLGENAIKGLEPWISAESGLGELYAKRYDQSMALTDTIKNNYGITNDDSSSMQAKLAGAFLTLRDGLTRYVTLAFGNYDTHRSHLATHLPEMQSFATGLKRLLLDLAATNDPEATGKKLIDTTTIVISSEFVRTPKFNLSAGTDHWQSGSMILMGNGIKDNVAIGATGNSAEALGWSAGSPVARSATTVLLPNHVAASLVRSFGYPIEADAISPVNLTEAFD
jgi:uncharacterized protein (DUF1501 family)